MGRINIMCWVVLVVLVGMAEGKLHKVGDNLGWTIMGNPNYPAWASSKVFRVGDTILFEYSPQFHNVLEVNKRDFDACGTDSPMHKFNTGNDSIVIKKAGNFYYLCGFVGHCQAGQKVEIKALASGSSGAPSAAPSGGPSPSFLPAPVTPGPTMPRGGLAAPPNQNNSAAPSFVAGGLGWLAIGIAAVAVM